MASAWDSTPGAATGQAPSVSAWDALSPQPVQPRPVSPQHAAIAARVANDQISQDSSPSFLGELARQFGNLGAGAVRGAGSIGATAMWPIDKATDLIQGDRGPSLSGLVTGQQPLSRNQERRQDMDAALATLGADTESPAYSAGKLTSEIAGTAGVGGLVGNTIRLASKAPAVSALADAIGSGGFSVGAGAGGTAAKLGIRAAGGAVQGGLSSGMIDPSTAGSGAVAGAVLPMAVRGVAGAANGVVNAVRPVIAPKSYAAEQLARALGDKAPQVADKLATAPTYVPGSVPTAAQAGADPALVMLEKSLANQNPGFAKALMERGNSNNAARLQAVGNIAQTPQALEAAIAERSRVTTPMRQFTVDNGNQVPVQGIDSALSSVANGPLGVAPTIGGATRGMQSELGDMTTVIPPNTLMNTPGSATASPGMLDALRQNSNEYLSKFAPNGAVGTKEQAAMLPIKGAIIDAIDAANPGHKLGSGGWGQGIEQAGPQAPSYRDYLSEFAKRSVPVNTMEVGQNLQGILNDKNLNSAGDAAATLTNYRGALAKALRGSDYAIDPQAQAGLENVQSDLQRATISSSVRSPGSDTAYNNGAGRTFLRAIGADDGGNIPAAVAGTLAGAATGSSTAAIGTAMGAKKASGWIANRVGDATGQLLLDPQQLASALKAQSAVKGLPPIDLSAAELTALLQQRQALALRQQQAQALLSAGVAQTAARR